MGPGWALLLFLSFLGLIASVSIEDQAESDRPKTEVRDTKGLLFAAAMELFGTAGSWVNEEAAVGESSDAGDIQEFATVISCCDGLLVLPIPLSFLGNALGSAQESTSVAGGLTMSDRGEALSCKDSSRG